MEFGVALGYHALIKREFKTFPKIGVNMAAATDSLRMTLSRHVSCTFTHPLGHLARITPNSKSYFAFNVLCILTFPISHRANQVPAAIIYYLNLTCPIRGERSQHHQHLDAALQKGIVPSPPLSIQKPDGTRGRVITSLWIHLIA
jgi:hypothetical protein